MSGDQHRSTTAPRLDPEAYANSSSISTEPKLVHSTFCADFNNVDVVSLAELYNSENRSLLDRASPHYETPQSNDECRLAERVCRRLERTWCVLLKPVLHGEHSEKLTGLLQA